MEHFKRDEYVQISHGEEQGKVVQIAEVIRVFESLDDDKKVNIEIPSDEEISSYFSSYDERDKYMYYQDKDKRNYIELSPVYRIYGEVKVPHNSLQELSLSIKQKANQLENKGKMLGSLFTERMREKNISYLQKLAEEEVFQERLKWVYDCFAQMNPQVEKIFSANLLRKDEAVIYTLESKQEKLSIECVKKVEKELVLIEMSTRKDNEENKFAYQMLNIQDKQSMKEKIEERLKEVLEELYEPINII